MAMKRKGKASNSEETAVKSKGLFDHVKHIRQVQSPDYYESLTESEQKSFSKYMILRVLSMDPNVIEEISLISKYMEVLPEKQMYTLLIKCLPKDFKFYPYIKKSTKDPNQTIIDCICRKFNVGSRDSKDYYNLLISTEDGIKELQTLVASFGYSQTEVEELFTKD